jgi:radical SAM protein with 4Fe4S-binding SPASM domain
MIDGNKGRPCPWPQPTIDVNHFAYGVSGVDAMELFKNSVQTVAISISSYCNRRCPYCPNSIVDRISSNNKMDDEIFFNILRHLCKVGFKGLIGLQRYNEPTADKPYLLSRIKSVKQFIPECYIAVYTNGDYLNANYVEELRVAGVSQIFATSHTPKKDVKFEEIVDNLKKHIDRIGLPYVYEIDNDIEKRVKFDAGEDIVFTFEAYDFYHRYNNGILRMSNRGNCLQEVRNYVREDPCWVAFTEIHVEWDGRLAPCCEIHLDAFAHDDYVLGHINANSDVFAEWCNDKYVNWRRNLFSYSVKKEPCINCTVGMVSDPNARQVVEQWRQALNIS